MQWDAVENKTSVVLYGAGAVVLLWFSNTLVGALNSVPLVGAQFERGANAVHLGNRSDS